MKKLNSFLISLWLILFVILAFAVAILPVANSNKYYMGEHKKNNVLNELYENCNVEITNEELNEINQNMIDYLFGRVESMQYQLSDGSNFFSEQAILHMKDVRTLFVNGVLISFVLLGVFLILTLYIILNFKKIKINYTKIYGTICLTVVVILALVVVYALIDFDNAFVLFHKIIFPNQDKFDSSFFAGDDTLITVLPINFFMKIAVIIASIYAILVVLGFVVTTILNKKINKKIF